MLNGILPVFKEEGYTSNDVVALLRGILKMKKIGHTGTLDPAATGVLPVCLGRGTKLVEMLTDTDKEYRTVMRLGVDTDTEDMTGTVLKTGSLDGIDENRVTDVLMSFVGD
nr:tRNA pseudouridine(55) synthase [Lachnospiraceae bacterium]